MGYGRMKETLTRHEKEILDRFREKRLAKIEEAMAALEEETRAEGEAAKPESFQPILVTSARRTRPFLRSGKSVNTVQGICWFLLRGKPVDVSRKATFPNSAG